VFNLDGKGKVKKCAITSILKVYYVYIIIPRNKGKGQQFLEEYIAMHIYGTNYSCKLGLYLSRRKTNL
jgi:hypothetical protein